MDNDDILALWNRYDEKLDRIEKLNRQIVYRMISKKTGFKLNLIKLQGLYIFLLAPVLFVAIVWPYLKSIPWGPWVPAGTGLVVVMLLSGMYFGARLFDSARKVRIHTDPVLETKRKLLVLRQRFLKGVKHGYVTFFIGTAGMVVMNWPLLKQSEPVKLIIFFTVFFTISLLSRRYGKRAYIRKLYDKMELEVDELKEYEML